MKTIIKNSSPKVIEPNNITGTYEKAKGGTEMMYEGLMKRLPTSLTDKFQIICSRVRELDPNKKKILWLHDDWTDPENEHLKNLDSLNIFEKLVFVSNYQFQTYHQAYGIPYNKSVVLKNAIEPIVIDKPKQTDKINLIYHTTPHRGLELLIPVFDALSKKYDNLHLDVFSSFDIYGWPKRNEPYQKLFDFCSNHPKINYHGTKSNEIVIEALKKSHIFAFPSIWPETSCIAAIEAMSAGNLIVCPDLAALPETTLGNAILYRYDENPQNHANLFLQVLEYTIQRLMKNEFEGHIKFSKSMADITYNWNNRENQWRQLLESL